MDKKNQISFEELEDVIRKFTNEGDIKFIRFPLTISKIRTRLLLLSSITIIGIYFNIEMNPKVLGFEFNNSMGNQNFPIMVFFLISLVYLSAYFIWNVIDYVVEYKIGNISNRGFGSIPGEVAKPTESLAEAINSFINYLKEFFNNQNISEAAKRNFETSYIRMGIYAKGLSIFNKSQLLRFYFIEVGLPCVLSVVAIAMIIRSITCNGM